MFKTIIYVLILLPIFGFAQTKSENYLKTTNYRDEYKGSYVNFSQNLTTSDFILNGGGGGSGVLKITDNILEVNFSGSWSAQRMKSGVIKYLNTSPKLPNIDLGPINHSTTSIPTGYYAKIKDNNLFFYSPYFLDGVKCDNTYPINAPGVNYSTNLPNLYACTPSGGGGSGGSVTIANNSIRLYLSGGWSSTCNLKTGQIMYLSTSTLPNIDLGPINSNLDERTVYRAKIENNWLVFYATETIPQSPVGCSMNFAKSLLINKENKQTTLKYYDGLGREKQKIQVGQGNKDKAKTNIIDWKSIWTLGSGSTGIFTANGTTAENNRINEVTPFGQIDKVWRCGSDVESDADGGWNTSPIQIDHKKAYQYCVWIKRKNSLNGYAHHGTGNVQNLDGTPDNNPYFWAGSLPALDKWYLLVGYIHPSDYVGSDTGKSGLYDMQGNKIINGKEFKWNAGVTSAHFRNYMYYVTDTNAVQYFYNPTLQAIDGSESTLKGILNNYDIPDLVTYFEYGGISRKSKEFLPYASQHTSSEQIYSSPSTDLNAFYNTPKFENTLNPFNEIRYEASSLDKVLEVGYPGNDWKIDPTSDLDNTVKMEYELNTAADKVKLYNVSINSSNISSLIDAGYYNDFELTKSVVKNENWKPIQANLLNNTSTEFKDKLGRVVLKREVNDGKWHDTYSVYDDYGNLSFALPPMVNTYPNNQQIWNNQYYEDYNIASPFTSGYTNNSGNELVVALHNGRLSGYFDNFGDGPNVPLNTVSPAIDLNFDPPLPDMQLGTVYTFVNGVQTPSGYTAYVQNGDIYFSGSNAIIDNGIHFYFDIDLGTLSTNLGITITPAILDELAFQYKYDNKNRQIERKLPGKETEFIVYDKLDRPVLTQDGNLRKQDKWLFVKYDVFNRTVYSGIWTNPNTGQSRDAVQQIVDSQVVGTWSEVKNSTALNVGSPSASVYYSNNSFPSANTEILNINYYDDYVFDTVGLVPEISFEVSPATNVKSLPTGTKVKILGTSSWSTSVTYYDNKARAILIATNNNYLNVVDKMKMKLDFVGNVLETESTQLKGTFQTTIKDVFSYDHAGRIISQRQKIDNQAEQLLFKNNYDELGRLVSKNVGGKTILTGEQGLQKIDFSYNVRGWLKEINDVSEMKNDLFAMQYFHQEQNGSSQFLGGNLGKSLFNGNISAVSWRSDNHSSSLKSYYYEYDHLDRLKLANFVENANSNMGKFNEGVSGYDRNGNILDMYRNGQSLTNPSVIETIDYLDYTYKGNQLISVDDSYRQTSWGERGFKDGNTVDDDYDYDENGNLIFDKNKGITTIEYNHLNLPTKIVFNNADTGTANPRVITYKYNALGSRIEKKVYEPVGTPLANTITTIHYNGGAVYKNNILEFFQQSEGYVAYDGNAVGDKFSYVFQYKDNVGNVRLSYKDVNNDGIVTRATTEIFFDGFETASGWDNQGFSWGTAISGYDNNKKRSGNLSGKVEKLSAGVKAVHNNNWVAISNTQPTDYIFSGWIYSNGPFAQMFLFENTSTETNYYTNVEYVRTDEKNRWVYVEKRVTVPANITKLNLRIDNGNGNGTVWFDNVSIRRVNPTNEIVEENNYYPFGLKHEGYNNIVSGFGNVTANKFKLTGKEHESELSLNTYDFGSRNYDPAVGRWTSFDPLAQKAFNWTPYRYAFNNPNVYIDPNGEYEINSAGHIVINNPAEIDMFMNYMANNPKQGVENYADHVMNSGNYSYELDEISITATFSSSRGMKFSQTDSYYYNAIFKQIDKAYSRINDFGDGLIGGSIFLDGQEYNDKGYSNADHLGAIGFAGTLGEGYIEGYTTLAKFSKGAGDLAKSTGKVFAGVGVVTALGDFALSAKSGSDYARLGGAALITLSGAIPVVGPGVSIALGVLDGAGAFDSFYKKFD
ncbi:DUF6443 domain-containing protein [Flavobacterium sp. GCM10027622]|uniref:DUF6443 domain-containing protein n=1 Tax=unclassified Flavobacterium TaxID=196869 RepID=UPI00360BB057